MSIQPPPRAPQSGDAAADLFPRVVHNSPAAVLLVDLTAGTVTYGNQLAQQLGGGASIPRSVSDWSTAAGLLTAGGDALEQSRNPLLRIAGGEPVAGEAISAALASSATHSREPLWVIGFPLVGAPGELGQQALVVILPLRDSAAVASAQAEAVQLQDRAVLATSLSFTISDPNQPDNPLVYLNPAFERTTGYTTESALGRNCRFLQGRGTDLEAVDRIRQAVRAGEAITETLLNYRADGTPFYNRLQINPVMDGAGKVSHFVGIQGDVTAEVEAERERELAFAMVDRAFTAEKEARAAAESASARLRLLAEATSMLANTLDVEKSLERLAEMVVPQLADWVSINLAEDHRVMPSVTYHPDPERKPDVDTYRKRQPMRIDEPSVIPQVIATGQPVLLSSITPELMRAQSNDAELLAAAERLGLHSALVVPLTARNRVLGSVAFVSGASRRVFTEDDLEVAADLARRAALMVDNARLYAREHETALLLQRSMLPTVPDVAGLAVSAAYLPGSDLAEVGGDWYDVLALPDGSTGIAIGDVMGHDLRAAAAMGQLRSVLRSYAWEGGSPAQVLDRMDRLVQGLGMAQLATCVYGRLEPTGHGFRLRYANAGHHAPLLRRPDGTVESLSAARDVVIGVAPVLDGEDGRDVAEVDLEPGCVLLLFTDGLVEDRERDLDVGVDAVRARLAAHRLDRGVDALCSSLEELVDGGQDDDVCLLIIEVLEAT